MSMETWIRELRYATRRMRATPAFSATIALVFMVAVGIGIAISSVATATREQAVPYPESENLIWLFETNPDQEIDEMQVSLPTLGVWQEQNRIFESLGAAYAPLNLALSTDDGAARLQGGLVSPELLDVLRIQPVRGRGFAEEEGRVGPAAATVILSHELWTRRFGNDPGLIGQTLSINGTAWIVIGVLPQGIPLLPQLPEAVDVWFPLGQSPTVLGRDVSLVHNFRAFQAIGRLKTGITDDAMWEEVRTLEARISELFPETSQGWGWSVRPLRDVATRDFGDPVRALVVGAILLFVVAIANSIGLFAQRARETVSTAWVRTALGATTTDLRRAATAEAALLTVTGTIVGLGLARVAIASRGLWMPFPLPPHIDVAMNWGVAVAALGVAHLTALTSGATTAAWWWKHAGRAELPGGGSHASPAWNSGRAIVGVQVALAAMLTVVGMLTVKSIANLAGADTGVRAENLLTVRVDMPESSPPDEAPRRADEILRALDAIPEITGTALWSPHVPAEATWHTRVGVLSRPDLQEPDDQPLVRIHQVGAGAATVLGLQFLEGGDFTSADRSSGRRVALISETAAREWWGDEPAVGRQIRRWNHDAWSTVVGVVRDAPLAGREGPGSDFFRDVFFLHNQDPQPNLVFLIRSRGSAPALAGSVRRAIRATAPALPIYAMRSMDAILGDQERVSRSTAALGIVYALTALALVAVGLYGILASFVSDKALEISLRKALGATPARIVREVTAPLWLTHVLGVVAGLGLAWLGVPALMAGVLFEVEPRNVTIYAVAGVFLLLATAPAILGPAIRGSSQNPVRALRRGMR